MTESWCNLASNVTNDNNTESPVATHSEKKHSENAYLMVQNFKKLVHDFKLIDKSELSVPTESEIKSVQKNDGDLMSALKSAAQMVVECYRSEGEDWDLIGNWEDIVEEMSDEDVSIKYESSAEVMRGQIVDALTAVKAFWSLRMNNLVAKGIAAEKGASAHKAISTGETTSERDETPEGTSISSREDTSIGEGTTSVGGNSDESD